MIGVLSNSVNFDGTHLALSTPLSLVTPTLHSYITFRQVSHTLCHVVRSVSLALRLEDPVEVVVLGEYIEGCLHEWQTSHGDLSVYIMSTLRYSSYRSALRLASRVFGVELHSRVLGLCNVRRG